MSRGEFGTFIRFGALAKLASKFKNGRLRFVRPKRNLLVRKLPAYEHLLMLAFAQLTWRESLRDIETSLAALGPKLYHAGFRQPIARSTLADANEHRDWRIFADFDQVLIAQATALYAKDPFLPELKATADALDSTTIDPFLSLFPWAKFRRQTPHVAHSPRQFSHRHYCHARLCSRREHPRPTHAGMAR